MSAAGGVASAAGDGGIERDVRAVLAGVREACIEEWPSRHEARQLTLGRLAAYGARPLDVSVLERMRRRYARDADDADDLAVFGPYLMVAQEWWTNSDGRVVGPAAPPRPDSPYYLDRVAALGGGPTGDVGPSAPDVGADPAAAAVSYLDWLERVRGEKYWRLCQERRALLIGRECMSHDPRPHAELVRRYRDVAGPRDVEALWSDSALALDYDVLRSAAADYLRSAAGGSVQSSSAA